MDEGPVWNRVLYRSTRYNQIAVAEVNGKFRVQIYGGDVIHQAPIKGDRPDTRDFRTPTDLESALRDAQKEYDDRVAAGWRELTPGELLRATFGDDW